MSKFRISIKKYTRNSISHGKMFMIQLLFPKDHGEQFKKQKSWSRSAKIWMADILPEDLICPKELALTLGSISRS
jgi:hypothetical protein